LRVYIAGPYTKGDVAINVRTAMEAGILLLEAGHAPFVPHLTHFLHMHKPQPYETWTRLDNAYLPYCEALIRLPGESGGADAEVALAHKFHIPVFNGLYSFFEQGYTPKGYRGEPFTPTEAQRIEARTLFDAAIDASKGDTEEAMVLSAEDFIIYKMAKLIAERDAARG
jgi:hypothetical protein